VKVGGRNASWRRNPGFPTKRGSLNIDNDNRINVGNATAQILASRIWAESNWLRQTPAV
jgi:hypothetical protein